MGKYSFGKPLRLNKEKHIQELFSKGSSFYLFPFKVLVLPHPDGVNASSHQVLISVSRKNFKKAVDRNLIKRRIREAFRLQQELLPQQPAVLLGFIYAHKEIATFQDLRNRMKQCLLKIARHIEQAENFASRSKANP
jgi:ribonuclease P protein component